MDFKKKDGACEVYTLQGEKEEWMVLRNLLAYARDGHRLLSSTEARMSKELQSEIYEKIFGDKKWHRMKDMNAIEKSMRDGLLREMETHLKNGRVLCIPHKVFGTNVYVRHSFDCIKEICLEWTVDGHEIHRLGVDVLEHLIDKVCEYFGGQPEYEMWWDPYYPNATRNPFA